MNAVFLDKIDEQLLGMLKKDSRLPISTLADTVGRSRTAVQARLRKLEKHGKILGYTIREPRLAASEQVGYLVLVSVVSVASIRQLTKSVSQLPEVSFCYQTFGEFDLAIMVRKISGEDLATLLDEVLASEEIIRTHTVVLVDRD
jgi:DNA-binding Lrp family transcriptional regulator